MLFRSDAICQVEQMPKFNYLRLLEEYNKLDELPFDYNRKYVSVLCEKTLNEKSNLNNENLLIVKGDVETVCKKCIYMLNIEVKLIQWICKVYTILLMKCKKMV